MQKISIFTLLGLLIFSTFAFLPEESHALSCIGFNEEVVDNLIEEGGVVIFEGKALQNKDFGKYEGQLVEVTNPLIGYVRDKEWVYYETHPDWGYLCSGSPRRIGETAIYVSTVDQKTGLHRAYQTVGSDSDMYEYLLSQKQEGAEIVEPESSWRVEELRSYLSSILEEIKLMIFEIRYFLSN